MNTDFEQTYIEVRKKENRIYTDSEVFRLPEVFPSHDHAKEWKVRKRSAQKLTRYLVKKHRPLKILEVGCGNGWLSFQLSNIRNAEVTGLDINIEEMRQAIRVFDKDNLNFVYGNLGEGIFEDLKFDCVVFAASIQYFSSLTKIIPACLKLLTDEGEVHLVDTYFYTAKERSHAANRTFNYYHAIGFPEMAENYYHHTYDDLRLFKYKIISNPAGIVNSLLRGRKYFPWIIIRA